MAGIWRHVEMTDGDIIRLFQSGKQGEKNYRQFDGEWFVLDESPEAIREASQQDEIDRLAAENEQLNKQVDQLSYDIDHGAGKEIEKLTTENERLKLDRDELLQLCERYGHWFDHRERWVAFRDSARAIIESKGETNERT